MAQYQVDRLMGTFRWIDIQPRSTSSSRRKKLAAIWMKKEVPGS